MYARSSAGGAGIWQPSLRVPAESIRGAVGAGDALAAGILHGLHEDWEIARCLRLGVSAAAACLGHPGASEGISCRRPSFAQLAEKLGFREMP